MDKFKLVVVSLTLLILLGAVSAQVTKSEEGVELRIEHTEFHEDDDMNMWTTVTEQANFTEYNVSFFVEETDSFLEPNEQQNNTYIFDGSFSSGEWTVGTLVESDQGQVSMSETITVNGDSDEEDSEENTDDEDSEQDSDSGEREDPGELDVEIELGSERITPGDKLEIRANVEGSDSENLKFNWRQRGLTSEDIHEKDQQSLTVETYQRPRGDEPEIILNVRDEEGYVRGEASTSFEWRIPNVDTEGLDVDYNRDSLTATVSKEELDEGAEFRAGTSLKGFNQIELDGRKVAGGVELEMDQKKVSEYENEELIPYSAIEISGENIEGLGLALSANIPNEWLLENDLYVSRREAYVGFYKVENGEWTELPVGPGYSGTENLYSVESEGVYENNPYRLDGDTTLVIAGDPAGIDFGKFAINARGGCERLEDDEPVPAGWEEIQVTCHTYETVDRVEEDLERTLQRIEESNYEKKIEEIRAHLDENRPGPARMKMEELQRAQEVKGMKERLNEMEERLNRAEERGADVEELREDLKKIREDIEGFEQGETDEESMREIQTDMRELGDRLMRQVEEARSEQREAMERAQARSSGDEAELTERRLNAELERVQNIDNETLERLQGELEQLESLYEEPEGLESRYTDVENMIANGSLERAQQEIEDIEQDKKDAGLEKIQTGIQTYETIERLRESEQIEQEQLKTLNQSEELLVEDQNVEEASNQVEEVRRTLQVQKMREVVFEMLENQEFRQLIRDVISEVTSGLF